MSLNDWLSRRRLYTPDRVAVVDDANDTRFSYAELDRRASSLAGQLRRLGVRPRDRVACLAGNRIEYVDLYFACGKLGAVLVPLNQRVPPAGIVELLADCKPKVLVHDPALADEIAEIKQANVVADYLPIVDSSQQADPMDEPYEARESDLAMILYTSGTTGRPKGAMITYRQIHWNALNTIIGLQLTRDDATFLNMPLYHTGGWHVLFTPLMLLGGRVLLQPKFDAERCNALLGSERITILFGVPTMLRMMCQAENFAASDFSRVRFAIFGGESCPLPVIETYAARGVAMRQGYGLTEAGPNCFSLPAEDAARKQGSIGFPNFHVGVQLRKGDGTEPGPDEVGELWMRGPHVFGGYWNNAAETERVLRDGWLATGDLMKRDDEGYFYVVGRKKDMYVSGGENVYPAQVERVLLRHPAVALAAVIGVPDEKWGETGCAYVQPQPAQSATVEDLLAWCEGHLAKFQCPTKIVLADNLPVGPSGKIDKRALTARSRPRT